MEEFAKIIYQQWCDSVELEELEWDGYGEAWEKVYDILNEKLASEIEHSVNKRVFEIQEKSFIAGFAYACKCLSNGKSELGGGKV